MVSNIVRTNYWGAKVGYKVPYSFQSLLRALKGEKERDIILLQSDCGCTTASCEATPVSSCEMINTPSCEVSTSCGATECI